MLQARDQGTFWELQFAAMTVHFYLSIFLHESMSSLMAYVGHRLHVIAEATLAQAAGDYWCWLAKQGGGLQWCGVSMRSTSACQMAGNDCCY